MPRFNRGQGKSGPMTKKKYVRKKKQQRRDAKKETTKDITQDYELKRIKATLSKVTQADNGYFLPKLVYTDITMVTGVNSQTTLATNTYLPINIINIPQGDDYNNRQGQFITIKNMDIRYSLRIDPASVVNDSGTLINIRVMLFCINRPNGVPGDPNGSLTPTFDDVFALDQTATMGRQDLLNPYNQEQRQNMHVYYDRLHQLSPIGLATTAVAVGQGGLHSQGRIRVRPTKKNERVSYNAATAGFTDIEQNMWLLFVASDNLGANTNPPEIEISGIVRYNQ